MSKHNKNNCYDGKKLKSTPEFIEFKNKSIDYFINSLRVYATYYKISIETVYEPKKDILSIYAWYDGVAVHTSVEVSFIMHNNLALQIVFEEIKHYFIKFFEEIENNQEHEVDEHWDLIDLGSM